MEEGYIPTQEENNIILRLAKNHAYSRGLDPETANDFYQEAMLRILSKWSQYDPTQDRLKWVLQVARNTIDNTASEVGVVPIPKTTHQRGRHIIRDKGVQSIWTAISIQGMAPALARMYFRPTDRFIPISRLVGHTNGDHVDLEKKAEPGTSMTFPKFLPHSVLACLWRIYDRQHGDTR